MIFHELSYRHIYIFSRKEYKRSEKNGRGVRDSFKEANVGEVEVTV